jgi:hypothetical protein
LSVSSLSSSSKEDSSASMSFPRFYSSINWKEQMKESKKNKDRKFTNLWKLAAFSRNQPGLA